jgi:hypothetical protein
LVVGEDVFQFHLQILLLVLLVLLLVLGHP